MQMTKCSPWGSNVQPYPSLKKKMMEFMRHWQAITTPFANRPVQPKSKAAAKKCNLVPLTRPNRAKLTQPRRVNVGPFPEATQQNWAFTFAKANNVADMTTSLACIQGSQLMDTSSIPSPTLPVVPVIITENSNDISGFSNNRTAFILNY